MEHMVKAYGLNNISESDCVRFLEKVLGTTTETFLFFDDEQKLVLASPRAVGFLSDILKRDMKDIDLGVFLEEVLHNDENTLETSLSQLDSFGVTNGGMEPAFRQIIELEDGQYHLVRLYHSMGGYTIVTATDVSKIHEQQDEVNTLYRNVRELTSAMDDQVRGLNRNLQELVTVLETMKNGIVLCNNSKEGGRVQYTNHYFLDLMGLEAKEAMGKPLLDMVKKFDPTVDCDKALKMLQSGQPVTIELSRKKNEIGQFWYELNLTPILDERGNPDLCVGFFNDVTPRKLKEAEDQQTQKLQALGQFSGGIAHDFNNILSVIEGYARLCEKRLEAKEPMEEELEKIISATQRGASLTRQLLAFSRHKVVIEATYDAIENIREQEAMLKPLLGAHVKLKFDLPEKTEMFIKSSPDTIAQILINMAANARDAMPEGGVLSVRAKMCPAAELPSKVSSREQRKSKTEYLLLSVVDTGVGIPPDVLEHIFDPFYTTKGHGTGLGLSMVYGIVEQMGGFVTVDSIENKGTRFEFYLPLTNDVPKQSRKPKFKIVPDSLEECTILLVEDEGDLRAILEEEMKDWGLNILVAEDANDALLKQDEYKGDIDILLTDIVMPKMKGDKLAELFTSLRPETKVVFISGYPDGIADDDLNLPEDPFLLVKPVQPDTLKQALFSVLAGEAGRVFTDHPQERWQIAQ